MELASALSEVSAEFTREVFGPSEVGQFIPGLTEQVWLYRYQSVNRNWTFCIGTKGEPQSGKLSLGGFRIVPEARAAQPNFSPEAEALGLACGMDEKVFWSRLIRVGGPLGIKNLNRVVGGKCVLLPSAGSRIGEADDFALLSFAITCMRDFEKFSGVFLTTGQDLGHGIMSDGTTSSLEYLHQNFHGSVLADTSLPTSEGNYYTLLGMLSALGLTLETATIGLYGCGNIGLHLFDRIEARLGKRTRDQIYVIEASENRRAKVASMVKGVYAPSQKREFLNLPVDVLVVNANGGTLDREAVDIIVANPRLRGICGCENLVMPDLKDADRLREARKLYCPTELCGMMGYLTAVEEYLSSQAKQPFEVAALLQAASALEPAVERAGKLTISSNFEFSFEEGMRKSFS